MGEAESMGREPNAAMGFTMALEALLDIGADPNALDLSGRVLRAIADANRQHKIQRFLAERKGGKRQPKARTA